MTRLRTMLLAGMLALSASIMAAPVGAQPPDAPPPGPVPGLPVYLALGDSYANGQQSAPIVPGDYWATVAGWRASGYVAQYHEELTQALDCIPGRGPAVGPACRHLQLVNLSRSAVPDAVEPPDGRPGVTTTLLIEEQLPAAEAILESRNGDRNPRNDVEVVTLTVGGNDFFGTVVGACLPTPGPACAEAISSSFTAFAGNYGQILSRLRAAAGPDTPIVTMTYDNSLPHCALGAADPLLAEAFGNWILEGGDLFGQSLPVGFNDLVRGISAANDAVAAEVFGLLGDGDFVGGSDCLHPTLSGHTAIAGAFSDAFAG